MGVSQIACERPFPQSNKQMKTWKLSTFDLFSLDMVIKGAWVYKELPEASEGTAGYAARHDKVLAG